MLTGVQKPGSYVAHNVSVSDFQIGIPTLMLDDKTPLEVEVYNNNIYIGCHRLTKGAWKLLKEQIDK